MSGIPWQQIRGAHIDPSSIKFTNLQNKQNMFENELFKPPTNKLTILSVDTHDRIAYNDNLFFNKLKYRNSRYFMPYEPDGNILRLWLRYNHLGKTIHDSSFHCNSNLTSQVLCKGAPRLCKGPDDGVKGGRIVSRLNVGNESVIDHFRVNNPDEASIGVADGNPFSLYFEFMPENLILQDGLEQTLWAHTEDPNGDYGTALVVNPDGKLIFGVKDNASVFDFTSPANKITAGLYHATFVTYNPLNNAITMTINNVPQSDISGPTPEFPDPISNPIWLGVRGTDEITGGAGKFIGRFADTRWYRGLIVNRDHETNIWNNKRSICASYAVLFGGGNDELNAGNHASLWSQALTKFSMSFWIYPTAGWDGTTRLVLNHGSGAQTFNVHIPSSNNGRIIFRIANGAGGNIDAFNDGLVLNKWNNIVPVYDNSLGSANLKLYVNALVGTNASLTESINQSANLLLGTDTVDGMVGAMRDFRWWTTVALTAAEVEAINAGYDSLVTTPDYWLKLTEGNDVPRDFIARILTGSLNNGAAWNLHASHRPTEYGKLDVIGYARFNSETYTSGFDSVGFDNVGFDTS